MGRHGLSITRTCQHREECVDVCHQVHRGRVGHYTLYGFFCFSLHIGPVVGSPGRIFKQEDPKPQDGDHLSFGLKTDRCWG